MTVADARKLLQQGKVAEAEQLAHRVREQSPDDTGALCVLGQIALGAGDAQQARAYLQRASQAGPVDPLVEHFLGRACESVADWDAALVAHENAVRLAPELFIARLYFAAALERVRQNELAVMHYMRSLNTAQAQGRWLDAQTTPAALQSMIEHAVRFVRENRHAALTQVIEPLRDQYGSKALERVEQSLRILHKQAAADYTDARQQPTFLYFPGLPTSPYLERSLFPWMEALEERTPVIREELLHLLPSAAGRERVFATQEIERRNLRGADIAPTWSGYYFYRHGERREDNCSACPQTSQALDALPLSHVHGHGPEVLFSVFTAGTHLLPHRGVTNTRLVGHLPLIIPADCALNVGGELHRWQEGRAVVFDDTYEHEAWNRSSQIRVVLIFDVWNPHLIEPERAAVAALVPAMGEFRQAVEAV